VARQFQCGMGMCRGDPVEVGGGVNGEVGALRRILARQAVEVLVGAALPG